MKQVPRVDYDSPWKEALELYLEPFLALCFPHLHAQIDWTKPYKSLDAELQQTVRDAEIGRRYADKLFELSLRNGSIICLFLHIEIQSTEDAYFAERMFVYWYRLRDRYTGRGAVVSLGILIDDRPHWFPTTYRWEHGGCRVEFTFPIMKLLDWKEQLNELEQSSNPFAVILRAQLAVWDAKKDPVHRKAVKIALATELYDRGYTKKKVLNLYRFIDWILVLPPQLEHEVLIELEAVERERQMPYITNAERIGMEKGRALAKEEMQTYVTNAERIGIEKGRALAKEEMQLELTSAKQMGIDQAKHKLLVRQVQLKFKLNDAAILTRLEQLTGAQLDHMIDLVVTAATQDEFLAQLPE